jgi:glycosyltransferase involved in cell wall biosynthesis
LGPSNAETKRLLLVTNRLAVGGAEQMLVTLAKALDRHRVIPSVACFKDAGPLASGLEAIGVRVHTHLLAHKYDALVIDRLARLIRSEGIDVLCAVGSGGDRMFWSTLAARHTGRACIVWSHLSPRSGYMGFERSNRAIYRWVNRFVASGRRHRLLLIREENLPAGRTVVIRNGIEVEKLDRPDLRDEGRRRLNVPDPKCVAIGIIANFRRYKRHDVFVEAASRLVRRHPQAVFYIIGTGHDEPTIRGWMVNAGLTGQELRLLGERDDLLTLIQGLDVVCLCSEWECMSIVMLEAMAAGKAFVGPAIGSLDEALIHGQTGLMIRPADAVSLANALEELIVDPVRRTSLGRQARTKVMAEFRSEIMARAFEDLVEEVCGRCCGRSRQRQAEDTWERASNDTRREPR